MFAWWSVPQFPESRLVSLYEGEGFGGEATMRAKVIRALIDEIRALRHELEARIDDGEQR
jgi:hypothetical protein